MSSQKMRTMFGDDCAAEAVWPRQKVSNAAAKKNNLLTCETVRTRAIKHLHKRLSGTGRRSERYRSGTWLEEVESADRFMAQTLFKVQFVPALAEYTRQMCSERGELNSGWIRTETQFTARPSDARPFPQAAGLSVRGDRKRIKKEAPQSENREIEQLNNYWTRKGKRGAARFGVLL